MAHAFRNHDQRPFETENFQRNFAINLDTVVVTGFSSHFTPNQIVEFFTFKEGPCVCIASKKSPPSVLLRFSLPAVAQRVLFRYNNADINGQKIRVLPPNYWHSIPGFRGTALQAANIPPSYSMRNNAGISSPGILPIPVQVPLVPSFSCLNFAQTFNRLQISAFLQRKDQPSSSQTKFSTSDHSPQAQRIVDRENLPKNNENHLESAQRNADKGSPRTSNCSDKNSTEKKQETSQKESDVTKRLKGLSIKRNLEAKGSVTRQKRLRGREKDNVNGRSSIRTRTAVCKTSSGITYSKDSNMDKSVLLQKAPPDTKKEKNYSTNSNESNKFDTKTSIDCSNNAEEGDKTKPKGNEASIIDNIQRQFTTIERQLPTSLHDIGGKEECLGTADDTKGKGERGYKAIQKDSVFENGKAVVGSKNDSAGENQQVTQGMSSNESTATRNDSKIKKIHHTHTPKDTVVKKDCPVEGQGTAKTGNIFSKSNSSKSFDNPKTSNGKNRSQTTNHRQNIPNGKRLLLENQHNGSKGKDTGLDINLEGVSSNANKIRQHKVKDSLSSSLSDVAKKTSTSPAESQNPSKSAPQKKKQKSSLCKPKEGSSLYRYYRFMGNVQDSKHASLVINRERDKMRFKRTLDKLPPRRPSPTNEGGKILDASRCPDRTSSRKNTAGNSGDVSTMKRSLEATGLLVAPSKRKCPNPKSTEIIQPLIIVDLTTNSKITAKKVNRCSTLAPPKEIDPDHKSIERIDKTKAKIPDETSVKKNCRNQVQNFLQERKSSKGDLGENSCHVDQLSRSVAGSSISTESKQSENENRREREASAVPKISDKESLKNGEPHKTATKRILSQKTEGSLANSKLTLAKLKQLKTNARKALKSLSEGNMKRNSESNDSQDENKNTGGGLLSIKKTTFETKSIDFEDGIVKSSGNHGGVTTSHTENIGEKSGVDGNNDLQTTDDQRLCVTTEAETTDHTNNSEKNLSASDLLDETCIPDTSDAKQETQLRNGPIATKDNLTIQRNTSKNNEETDRTNTTCDALNTGDSASRESNGLPFSTISRSDSDIERKKVIKLAQTSSPKKMSKEGCSSVPDTSERPNCVPVSGNSTSSKCDPDKTTSSSDAHGRCSTNDKQVKGDIKRTENNSESTKISLLTRNANRKSIDTSSTVSTCGHGGIMSSAPSPVPTEDVRTIGNKERCSLDCASIDEIQIPRIANDDGDNPKRNSISQDVNNCNITRGIAVTVEKRKRNDEPSDVAKNKHQKCSSQSRGNCPKDTQNNGTNSGIDRVQGFSNDKRPMDKQERCFILENVLAIHEQYEKESNALLKNVKMLASMDSSLTEKLKSAFEDSLAEIGRRYLLELNKLKRKNDDYKKKQKLAQASNISRNKPNDKQQATAKGKTLTGQGIGSKNEDKNKINNSKQSTFQGKTPSVKEKGEGITPQNKPNNKQRSASQVGTSSEHKIGENQLPGDRHVRQHGTFQGKTPSVKEKGEGITPPNKPNNKQRSASQVGTSSEHKIGENQLPGDRHVRQRSTFQGKTPSVKEKGEGITPPNKPNNKQRSPSQGEQKIGENELPGDRHVTQRSTFQGKTPVQEKVGEGRPPQNKPEEKKGKGKEFVHPFTKKTKADTNDAGYGQTGKQQISAGSNVAKNTSEERSNVQVRIPQTCVPVSRHSQPGSPRCLVHLGSPHNPSMRLNIPLCGW